MTNNTTSNNTNNTRTAATYFTFDHFGKKIIGSELNFKKAGVPGSDQYKALMAAMAAHPNYTLFAVAPKKEKQTYAGLTIDLMEEYLNLVFEGELATTAREKFAEMKAAKEEKKIAFATIKSWFLDMFPHFNVEKAKRDIKAKKLANAKAPYKVVKVSVGVSHAINK